MIKIHLLMFQVYFHLFLPQGKEKQGKALVDITQLKGVPSLRRSKQHHNL